MVTTNMIYTQNSRTKALSADYIYIQKSANIVHTSWMVTIILM